MTKTAIVIGATGLVGAELVRQLLESPHYSRVTALLRRPIDQQHPKFHQEILDFDHPDPALLQGDDLYCAIGSTLAKAGSREAQYKIDCLYPYEIARIARANGMRRFLLVSSVGANAGSSNFYLRTKGESWRRKSSRWNSKPLFLPGRLFCWASDRNFGGENASPWLCRSFFAQLPLKNTGGYRALR